MRFKFCGNLDAPNWLLAEIATISKLTVVRLKLLTIGVAKLLSGEMVDESTFDKHITASNLTPSDGKSIIAANTVRFEAQDEVLTRELQQIGLPNEHCEAITKEVSKTRGMIMTNLKQQTFKLPTIQRFDWRVEFPVISSSSDITNQQTQSTSQQDQPYVHFNIESTNPQDTHTSEQELTSLGLSLSTAQFAQFIQEMEKAERALSKVTAEMG
ncbi:MAG: hypothetical protein EZS28_004308 [Streblomastix strix]|uniref:COMM domain-containing protein n=1 Tax=Streblomastix strix TaxID=222440 RepID=A0A5J4WZ66_9EUKA|nr:MAG: hypothetical protein EZS28_004308 [Streblomastix strix]